MFRRPNPMYAHWLPMAALLVAAFTSLLAAQEKRSMPASQTEASVPAALKAPVRLTALAVRTVDASIAQPVTITLQRWSTDEEAERWQNSVREATQKKMIDTLRSYPSIGRLGSTGTVGVDLRFARATGEANSGKMHITLAADRVMGFWEQSTAPRSTEYPFMLIDIQLDANGTGSGKIVSAAKMMVDEVSKTLIIENFEDQPVLLQTVKLQKR